MHPCEFEKKYYEVIWKSKDKRSKRRIRRTQEHRTYTSGRLIKTGDVMNNKRRNPKINEMEIS